MGQLSELRYEHAQVFYHLLVSLTPLTPDPSVSLRALLTSIRLVVGALGFAAFALLGVRRPNAALVCALAAALLAGTAAGLYAGPWMSANLVTVIVGSGIGGMVARFHQGRDGRARLTLGAAAIAGVVAMSNFLVFHDWRAVDPTSYGPVHIHDQFHYYLGAKYFSELSYDGLYACTAQVALERGDPIESRPMRDLHTNRVYAVQDVLRSFGDCRKRFTAGRWNAYAADVAYFLDAVDAGDRQGYIRDHGYNATPVLTVLHRSIVGWTRATRETLMSLAMIDVALFALSAGLILWAFGAPAAALSVLAWGSGILWVFDHMGIPGSLGRLWWETAVVAAVCLARRQHFCAAGLFIAFATSIRAFPAVFLFAPIVVALYEFISARRLSRWVLELLSGAAIGGAALAIVPVLAFGGVWPYAAFLDNVLKHAATPMSNLVGLPRLIFSIAYWPTGPRGAVPQWSALNLGLAIVLFGYVAWVVRRLEPFAILALGGLAAMFAFVATANYDYAILILLAPVLLSGQSEGKLADLGVFAVLVLAPNALFLLTLGRSKYLYFLDSIVVLVCLLYFATRFGARPGAARYPRTAVQWPEEAHAASQS